MLYLCLLFLSGSWEERYVDFYFEIKKKMFLINWAELHERLLLHPSTMTASPSSLPHLSLGEQRRAGWAALLVVALVSKD